MNMQKIFIAPLLLIQLLLPASYLFASEYSVRPFLIDVEVLPRDVVTKTVQLTNDSENRKYIVFATVNEISVDNEGEIKQFISPVMTDRTVTMTSWIEVKRGRIEIPPGEQREVPITFRINPFAEPGEYHAFIGFVPAANRPTAEKIALEGEADGVVVKITVTDQRSESMRIKSFLVDRFVFDDSGRSIEVEIENKGDIDSAPVGELIFYNSRGAEVDAIPFNTENVSIAPGETKTMYAQVPQESNMGRIKANLSLHYGEKQTAQLQDTTFFYFIPLHIAIIIGVIILILALVVTYLFKRAFMQKEYHEDADEVQMYVREGHDPNPQDHDINLRNDNTHN